MFLMSWNEKTFCHGIGLCGAQRGNVGELCHTNKIIGHGIFGDDDELFLLAAPVIKIIIKGIWHYRFLLPIVTLRTTIRNITIQNAAISYLNVAIVGESGMKNLWKRNVVKVLPAFQIFDANQPR